MHSVSHRVGLLIAVALLVRVPGYAQTTARSLAPPVTSFFANHLGKGYEAISGSWAFHPGDNPAWASPGFDDSGWVRIKTGRTWEEQGFHNLTGFAWYRRRVELDAKAAGDWTLVLYLAAVQSAAEVYWNGRLVGGYGKVPPDPVWYDPAWPLSVAVVCPACGRGQIVLGRPQSGVLAIRVWTAPYVFFSGPHVGGLASVPVIGSAEAIRDQVGRQNAEWLESSLYWLGLALVEGVVALLALLAWLRDWRRWMLFWLAVYTAHAVLLVPFGIPGLLSFRWAYGLIAPVVCVEDVSLWFLLLYLLRLRDDRRLVRWTLGLTGLALVGNFGDGALQLFNWTTWPGHRFLAWDIGLTIPSLLIEAWVLVLVGFALRHRLDAARWLLAISATLVDAIQAVNDWGDAGVRWTHSTAGSVIARPLFTIAGNAFTPARLADTLLLVAILYAVWRYEAEQRERQAVLDEEYRNAQELQHVLVPRSLPQVAGYVVSSAYRPAQVVGGDFFQIITLPGGDSLAVVGDVSGKGLKAAMTVSLVVGALRAFAEVTSNPAALLAALNRRLHERLRDGFSTCIAVRIDSNGTCLIASAGHLAPYRNGQEISLPSGLPLGVVPEAEYSNISLQLSPAETLTLLSDGVVEARNQRGELFGFHRTRDISRKSAEEIAQAAQKFGQEDDITVLTLTFTPTAEIVHA